MSFIENGVTLVAKYMLAARVFATQTFIIDSKHIYQGEEGRSADWNCSACSSSIMKELESSDKQQTRILKTGCPLKFRWVLYSSGKHCGIIQIHKSVRLPTTESHVVISSFTLFYFIHEEHRLQVLQIFWIPFSILLRIPLGVLLRRHREESKKNVTMLILWSSNAKSYDSVSVFF